MLISFISFNHSLVPSSVRSSESARPCSARGIGTSTGGEKGRGRRPVGTWMRSNPACVARRAQNLSRSSTCHIRGHWGSSCVIVCHRVSLGVMARSSSCSSHGWLGFIGRVVGHALHLLALAHVPSDLQVPRLVGTGRGVKEQLHKPADGRRRGSHVSGTTTTARRGLLARCSQRAREVSSKHPRGAPA